MRTFTKYIIVKYHPDLQLHYKTKYSNHVCTLNAGYSDTIHVYIENDVIYVLSINYGLGYVGIDCFNYGTGANDGYFFDSNISENMPNWEQLTPIYLLKIIKCEMCFCE